MEVYIGLGSNLGERRDFLSQALKEIKKHNIEIVKTSAIYENPALLPMGAKSLWNKTFLNMAILCRTDNPPSQLLDILKKIESFLGRKTGLKWAPRSIDLDILVFENESVFSDQLKIPHPDMLKRNFVLAPLKDLKPHLKVPGCVENVLKVYRSLKKPLTGFMQTVNATPDSFSDGGLMNLKKFNNLLEDIKENFVSILDLGAESTRPGAGFVSAEEEWQRLLPYISAFFDFYKNDPLCPRLSIDTRHIETACRAVDKGVDIINDVSGLCSEEMLDLLKNSSVEYVLMHSLSIPADPKNILPESQDPVLEIKNWLKEKIQLLQKKEVDLNRIIFDPGIGFGKNAYQSLEILKRAEEFQDLPFRILVGHSRKSFMKGFSSATAGERDAETAGLSAVLAAKGVDILRVHNSKLHACLFRGAGQII